MKQRVTALSVQSILSAESDMEVIVLDKKCSNLDQLFNFAPDLVITDLETCSRQPAKSVAALRENGITRFLFLYAPTQDSTSAAIKLGADGLISKSSPSHELSLAVRALAEGKCWIDEVIWRDYLSAQGKACSVNDADRQEDDLKLQNDQTLNDCVPTMDPVPTLTKKETEVLRLAASGLSNQQIALKMESSLETINCYMWLIAKKLHARGRIQAVNVARQSGIFS